MIRLEQGTEAADGLRQQRERRRGHHSSIYRPSYLPCAAPMPSRPLCGQRDEARRGGRKVRVRDSQEYAGRTKSIQERSEHDTVNRKPTEVSEGE